MSFNEKQTGQLLRPINEKRVLHLRGQSHLPGWDVKAHLTRIFGFEGWDKKIRSVELVFEDAVKDAAKKDKDGAPRIGWWVTYRCLMTLIIKDPQGRVVREIDGAATGSAENLPQRGEAHDFALKNSVTYALKVCATDLGDQFGLSLYNNGQTAAVIGRVLSAAGADKRDAQVHTPDAVSDDTEPGAEEAPSQEASDTNSFDGDPAPRKAERLKTTPAEDQWQLPRPLAPPRARPGTEDVPLPDGVWKEPVTDQEWLTGMNTRIATWNTQDESNKVWADVVAKKNAGDLKIADFTRLRAAWQDRAKWLKEQEATAPTAIITGWPEGSEGKAAQKTSEGKAAQKTGAKR